MGSLFASITLLCSFPLLCLIYCLHAASSPRLLACLPILPRSPVPVPFNVSFQLAVSALTPHTPSRCGGLDRVPLGIPTRHQTEDRPPTKWSAFVPLAVFLGLLPTSSANALSHAKYPAGLARTCRRAIGTHVVAFNVDTLWSFSSHAIWRSRAGPETTQCSERV